jgi:hypothetical protein
VPPIRKKFSEKVSSSSYDQFSDRLVESINMVREKMEQKNSEMYDLEK